MTDGGVSGGPYQISVRVTTTNGKITRVQDNGTEAALTMIPTMRTGSVTA